jgi:phosphodiester glycosidase
MELNAATRPLPGASRRRQLVNPRRAGLYRVRRIALLAALLALLPALFSYISTMAEPSNSSLGIRTVEWLRDHGAAGLVAQVESTYYALTAPSKGGPTLRALPNVGYGAGRSAAVAAYRPPRVAPLIRPALPGEGAWRPTRPGLAADPPVLLTTLRNQPEYPRVVAGLAWIDTKRTTLTLHPGRQEPSVSIPRGSMEVPKAGRGRLIATFNSGFKLSDSHGGVVLNGHTFATMHDGQGTLVGYTDGRVDVIDWGYGPIAPSSVSFARQNLPLIVDEGRPTPNLANGEWGATVGNAVLVWRSGIGVDRHGNLIYAAGNDQSAQSLANTLVHAGAVRAMELDINSYWVSFITYGAPGAEDPTNLLPDMERSDTRYLEPDDRDFFAVYAR